MVILLLFEIKRAVGLPRPTALVLYLKLSNLAQDKTNPSRKTHLPGTTLGQGLGLVLIMKVRAILFTC
ncbi:MAG TPA: hypothetical protein DEQ04_06355 [Thermovirga lienii]|nr:hypothetical protein [Thermovirga lienii]